MAGEEVALIIPRNIMTIIQALGGIIFLYLIFGVTNAIILHRRNKKLNKVIEGISEMGDDVKAIKKMFAKKFG